MIDAAEMQNRGMQQIAAGVSSMASSMARAQENAAALGYSKAKAGFAGQLIEQQSALERDPEWATHEQRFTENVGKARKELAASISDPRLRQQFEIETALDLQRGTAAVRSRAFDLEARDGVQTLDNSLNTGLQDYLKAPDGLGRTRAIQAVDGNLKAAVKAGYISEPLAQEQRRQFQEKAAIAYLGKFGKLTQLAMLTGAAAPRSDQPVFQVGAPKGLIAPGNIDLASRPTVQSADGSISTVRSMSFRNEKGQEVLIPTVSDDGKILSEKDAVSAYGKTGRHLGIFDNPDDATAYALSLHNQQAAMYGKDAIGQQVLLPPDVDKAIKAAAWNPSDAPILARIAQLESKGDANAINPESGAKGVFQFMPKTAAQYGLGDPGNVQASAEAAAKLLNDNRKTLRGILGREPSGADLYLAHQQGASGASALLANPDKTAIEVLTGVYGEAGKARAAILQNGGTENMTAGQFTEMWQNRYDGGSNSSVSSALDLLPGEKPEGGWNFAPTGTEVDFIPIEKRNALIEGLLSEVREERRAARSALQGEISLTFEDQKATAYQIGAVDQSYSAKIMAAHPGADGAAKIKALEESATLGRDNNAIKGNTWAQDDETLAKAAAAIKPGEGAAFATERYNSLAKVIADKRDWLAKDPAGYAQTNNPAVADAWAKALDEGAEAIDVRLAVDMTRNEQLRLGVPPDKVRALPENLAQPLTDRIKAAKNPEERLAAIMTLASPKDPDTSALILNELAQGAGDDGARYALAGGLALEGPAGQQLGLDILSGMDAVSSGAAKAPKGEEVLTAVDEKLGTALSFNPQARAAIVDAAAAIYANDAFRAGEAGAEFDTKKFGAALDRVTGGVVEYNDAKIIVPRRGMTEDEFEDVMDGLTVQDIGGTLPLADDGSPVSIDDIRDGTLQNIGDGVYLVSVAGYPVIDPRNKQPFVLDLRNVQAKPPEFIPLQPAGIGFPVNRPKGQ
jgi:hypothetical protein